jgi:oligopeptidase B
LYNIEPQAYINMKPPIASKHPKVFTIHGDTRVDHYYWLRDRENEEVLDYLKAENEYTKYQLESTTALQEKIYQEIIGRIKPDETSVPYKRNGYYYITRYEKGGEYPIFSRKKGSLEAEEEIMLNGNQLAEGHAYHHIGSRSVSPGNHILAYAEDTVSRRIYTIKFKNLETGALLPDEIPGTTGSAAWANDNQTVFYTLKDETTLRGYKIMRHRLGQPIEDDVEIFTETDETYLSFVYKTKSEQYIVIGSYANMSQEYRVLDANTPDGEFQIIQERIHGLEYDIAHFEGQFYIRTNLYAQNFRLMSAPVDQPGKEHWKELIPHRKDVLLEDMDIFKDYLVLSERLNGITQLRIIPNEGEEHYIQFDEEAYLAYTGTNYDFDTELLRIGYSSMTTPTSVYDYHMQERSLSLLKRQEVLGAFKPEDYAAERLLVTARDGATVPISLVYKKGFKRDGQQPLLLYGYGSYGHSMEPFFNAPRLSLLDRGITFAIAHIRGGEEMGRHWYDNGKKLHKKNTFTDFIDCAEHLLAQQYTSKDRLFAMGGSAGGLLVGAVMNMRPDLWKGIIAAVPFVDVVTTMLDESIPLTTGEYDEWGNPNEKEYYHYIKSYSPYDNVEARDYPALLVTTGLHDSQVQYWEPAKWVAKLRELKTDNNLLLLHTQMDAGHGGASGRYRRHKETALEYAFIMFLLGIKS